MGVRKFRSVEDMPGPPARPALDPENLRIALGLASIANGFAAIRYAPGVRRFRSWAELQEHREHVQALTSPSRSSSRNRRDPRP